MLNTLMSFGELPVYKNPVRSVVCQHPEGVEF